MKFPCSSLLPALVLLSAPLLAAPPSITKLTSFGGDGWLAPGELAFLGTLNTERGLSAGSNGHVYVVSRNAGSFIYILDGTTGANLGTLSTTGVAGGTFLVNTIGVGSDGAIYVGNLATTSGTGIFKVYKWATEASAPVVVYTGTGLTGARIGDSLDAFGSGPGARVVVGFGSSPVVAGNNGYGIIDVSTGTFTSVGFTGATPAAGDFRLGLTFTDVDTIIGTQGGAVERLTDYAGTVGTFLGSPPVTSASERACDYTILGGIPFLATVDSAASIVRVYNMSTPLTPVKVAEITNTFGTLSANSNGTGGVGWGAVTDNTARLYAMATNQGVQAFTFDSGVPAVPPISTTDVVIEEIVADNAAGLEDEDLDQPSWIELFNGTAAPINVTGWKLRFENATVVPPVSLTWTVPTITIPSFGYQVVFASGKDRWNNVYPHTNFTLLKAGGKLTLLHVDGTTVADMWTYPAQKEDLAYGKLGAPQTLGFLETPTPGTTNAGRQAAAFRPSDPVFFKPGVTPEVDQPSKVITAALTLGIHLPTDAPAGAVIRYTTDLSEPTETSTLYNAPLSITASQCIKARVFAAGALPSRTGNRSFVFYAGGPSSLVTDYNGTPGVAFSSNLPVMVFDSFQQNIDGTASPNVLRPFRFSSAAIYDTDAATGRASLAAAPTQVLRTGTHVRGQSSSSNSAKPYAIEFWKENEDTDRTEPLLGMPSGSDWVLSSLSLDNSLMRNYIMQQIVLAADGPGSGMRCRFVEVFYNQDNNNVDYADYRGVYLLMEKIARGKERVNIAKLNSAMSDPALLSGGYIVKNDKSPFDSPFTANSNANVPGSSRTYDIYDPEPPTAAQAGAITTWFNNLTTALGATDFGTPSSANYYGKWLDERTFIDKTLLNEMGKEVDSYIFSSYFNKDRNDTLHALPLWDTDRALGNTNYGGANSAFGFKWWFVGTNYTYYSRLDQDAEYRDHYWNRWCALRSTVLATQNVLDIIDNAYGQLTDHSTATITNTAAPALQVPAARNFKKYPKLGAGFFAGMTGLVDRDTYAKEISAMKLWIIDRLNWMDQAAPLRPPVIVNATTDTPTPGGNVPVGQPMGFRNLNPSGGTVFYTIDGPDPRQVGGGTDPAALTASARTVTSTTLVPTGSTWKWLLPASAPDPTWKNETFDDTSWTANAAPLGYGETSGLTTNIAPTAPSYTTATAEPGAAYFRTTFTVADASLYPEATLEIQADDGAVIYVNGVEAGRANYPYAPTVPAYGQEASGPVDPQTNKSDVESLYFPVRIGNLLKTGVNTIAVEVHQAVYTFPPSGTTFPTNTISDCRFDCRLLGLTTSAPGPSITFNTPGVNVVRSRVVLNGGVWSPLCVTTFVSDAVPANFANLVVSELHYHPSDPTPAELALGFNKENDFEFIELMNVSTNQAVDLTGVLIQDAVDFNFTNAVPAARYLAPSGRVVVVENLAAFNSRLAPGATPLVAGAYAGNFSNKSEQITIRAANGDLIRQFTYHDDAPWPNDADGHGYSLVLVAPRTMPDHNLAASWLPSPQKNGDPGTTSTTPFTAVWFLDANNNGLSDGVEYALAGSALPVSSQQLYSPIVGVVGVPYLFVTFQINLHAAARVFPELSGDLSTWSGSGLAYVSTVHDPATSTATVTYRSTVQSSLLPPRLFVRVTALDTP